jgi:hypothetical protein
MTYEDILRIFTKSDPDDWNVITCWGAGSGPSYLTRQYAGDGQELGFMDDHGMRASYKPDIAIGLAWGMQSHDTYHADWVSMFKSASSSIADLFYNGMLVAREHYVVVDDGGGFLPRPDAASEDGRVVPTVRYDFIRLLDNLELRTSEFDRYFGQAGLSVAQRYSREW